MNNGDIAIIGMAGRFPGARSVAEFYRNLREGVDSVREVSSERIASTGLGPGDYQLLAYLDGIDQFDYAFFDILLGEAQYMDPHQRILLEVAYQCLENAGYNVDAFDGSLTSVYLGDTDQRYYALARENHPALLTGNLNATAAGRIARFFNLTGNALMVDTACSSSLVALYLACNDLVMGESDHALVGGASLILFPPKRENDDETGIDSPDGRAKAFAASANGTANGEAVACVLLKRLADARRDGDIIHGVIKGVGVGQDARRSSSLTAPSSIAQAEVLARVYRKAGINPEALGCIEAHGTGTPLGDPIEIDGIKSAFARFTDKKQFCAISAVKTNVGHTDTAAGIVGLVKLLLSLRHGVLFPSLHFDEPNPHIDFLDSPVYVNTELTPWATENGRKRLGAVSSFGISGTNCHAVVEEWPGEPPYPAPAGDAPYQLYLVSAKSESSLAANLGALGEHLAGCSADGAALAYTLHAGRKHYPYRYACVAAGPGPLRECIGKGLLPGHYAPEGPLRELWVLFPDESDLSLNQMDGIAQSNFLLNAIFRRNLQVLQASPGADWRDGYRFIFQYSLYQFLRQAGLDTNKMLGLGAGKRIIRVIKGEVPLENALRTPAPADAPEKDSLKARLAEFAGKKLGDASGVLVLAPDAGLLGALEEIRPTYGFRLLGGHALRDAATPLLDLMRSLYLAGVNIAAGALYPHPLPKVELPPYQFLRTRCWLDAPADSVRVQDWFYALQWVPAGTGPAPTSPGLAGRRFLVVGDHPGLAERVAERLQRSGNATLRVQLTGPGDGLQPAGDDACALDIDNETAGRQLLAAVAERLGGLDGIIVTLGFDGAPAAGPDTDDAALESRVCVHLKVLKLLRGYFHQGGFQVLFASRQAHYVTGTEEISLLGHASAGLYRALQSEYSNLRVHAVDFGREAGGAAADPVPVILGELASDTFHTFSAWRGGERYVPQLEKMDPAALPEAPLALREDGVYLVTGGASGVGAEVTAYLAARTKGVVAVMGRTELPPPEAWRDALLHPRTENEVRSRIAQLLRVEDAGGARVVYFAADLGDAARVREVFGQLYAGYGRIDGIVHAAGEMGPRVPLAELSLSSFRKTLVPKVRGTVLLKELTRTAGLQFFVLFSSFNATLPQANTLDYTTANAFEDAFGQYMHRAGIPAKVINWGAWGETGAGDRVDVDSPDNRAAFLRAWRTRDGLRAFALAVQTGAPHVQLADVNPAAFLDFPFFKQGKRLEAAIRQAGKAPARQLPGQVTPTEAELLEIWYAVLKKDVIALEDNFFELGGHSLLASRIINLTGKAFGVTLAFRDMFKYPSIGAMARHIEQLRDGKDRSAARGITPAPPQPYYDVSPAQRRLWTAYQIDQHKNAYNLWNAVVLEGTLHYEAFVGALNHIVSRHEVLRTSFLLVNNELKQQIHPFTPGMQPCEVVDLSGAGGEAAARQRIEAEALLPFDLEKAPLLRTKLFALDGERYVFMMVFHHLVSDAWSAVILPRELAALYNAFLHRKRDPLPALAIQYKDYAAWITSGPQQERMAGQRQYWSGRLGGQLHYLKFPLDKPRPDGNAYTCHRLFLPIGEEVREAVKKRSQQYQVTVFSTLLTTIKWLLCYYTGQRDILVGMPASERSHFDLDDQMGFYVNMLPIRTLLSEQDSFADSNRSVQQALTGALENQLYPFELMLEDLKVERLPGYSPLFNITVTQNLDLGDDESAAVAMEGLRVKEFPLELTLTSYDLNFDVSSLARGIFIEYNANLFHEQKIQLFADRLLRLIARIAAGGELSLLGVHAVLDGASGAREVNLDLLPDLHFS